MRAESRNKRQRAIFEHTKGRNFALKLYELNENFPLNFSEMFNFSLFSHTNFIHILCMCQTAFHKNKQTEYEKNGLKIHEIFMNICVLVNACGTRK